MRAAGGGPGVDVRRRGGGKERGRDAEGGRGSRGRAEVIPFEVERVEVWSAGEESGEGGEEGGGGG